MSYTTEVAKLKSSFSKRTLKKDVFDNNDQLSTDFPCIKERMDLLCPNFYTTKTPLGKSGGVLDGMFAVQWHRASIEEHSDDADSEELFQMYIVHTKRNVNEKSFDTRPVFKYYDGYGDKTESRLECGSSYIFKHSKPHSVIYYGDEFLVVMRSVWKNKHYRKFYDANDYLGDFDYV